MLFEIYTKEIELNGDKYQIKPLSGRFLPKLYKVMGEFEKHKGKDDNVSMEALSEEVIKDLHILATETFKASYPNTKAEEIEAFVSQNLLQLLEGLIEVNLNAKA